MRKKHFQYLNFIFQFSLHMVVVMRKTTIKKIITTICFVHYFLEINQKSCALFDTRISSTLIYYFILENRQMMFKSSFLLKSINIEKHFFNIYYVLNIYQNIYVYLQLLIIMFSCFVTLVKLLCFEYLCVFYEKLCSVILMLVFNIQKNYDILLSQI